jgi:hypothetical protein
MNYSYGIAAESTASSPCSNVPIHCPICPKADPAIWKYFMKVHFEEKHKTLDLTKYEHLWKLSNFERSEMKKIWIKQGKVTAKRTRKSKVPPLVISENHRARIPEMRVSFFVLPQYEKGLLTHLFISDDGEMHPTRSPSSQMDEVAGDPEGTDSDEEEAGGFDEEEGGGFNEEQGDFNEEGGLSGKEEVAKDGDLGRRSEDADGVVCMERQKVNEECEMPGMWDDIGSVRNSEDSGLEHVPITQEEPSIIDSVSPND